MNTILVTTSRGLDDLLRDEISALCPDCEVKQAPGQVQVSGELTDAYRIALWSRLANRVIWVLQQGKADNSEELYATASQINWPAQFGVEKSFSIQFNGTNRAINNSQFGALKIKDAIVDQFTELMEKRPDVERHQPDIMIHARLHRDNILIGIDIGGGSLHQRAYRTDTGEAPLKEHVASAILLRSGWSRQTHLPLADPMCGSGTIAIEGALMATDTAPALQRQKWGFKHWQGHDDAIWQSLIEEAMQRQQVGLQNPVTIYASDVDRRLVAKAKANADAAGVFRYINFNVADATKTASPNNAQPGYLVCNPPYGERLGELTELLPLFSSWGQQLKQGWQQWHVSLLSSNRELLRVLKLRADKEYRINNGKLECTLVNYHLNEANCEQFGESSENHPFANRLRKNQKRLKKWIEQQQTNCYRLYDADLPEYNVAVDIYADHVVVQEYAAPKDINEDKANRRLQEVLLQVPAVLNVPAKNLALKVRRQQKGKQQYEKMAAKGERLKVFENGVQLWVNLHDYLDTGLFLDHRETRALIKSMARDKDVLNLFSYTGSVSVVAAKGGARSVTTVDMSKTYLNWAKDNFALNQLKGPYAFIQADCTQWLAQNQGKYDLIFVDPPSFSNSKRMNTTWDVQRDHVDLLTNAARCLTDDGKIVFSNNRRGFTLDEQAMQDLGLRVENISKQTIPLDFERHQNIHQCWVLSR